MFEIGRYRSTRQAGHAWGVDGACVRRLCIEGRIKCFKTKDTPCGWLVDMKQENPKTW